MTEVKTKLAEGGRVVIPMEYRQALGLHIGDELILRLEDGEVRIFTPRQALKKAQELIRNSIPPGRSLADELMEERRKESQE